MAEIVGSVGWIDGRQCRNRVDDQQTVIDLLNKIPVSKGGAMGLGGIRTVFDPPRGGFASKQLHQAILHFQRTNQAEGLFVDGHVDPGDRCIQLMNRLAEERPVAPNESTQFHMAFIDDPLHPSVSPAVVISAFHEAGVKTVYYRLQPRSFAAALERKMGTVASSSFRTPEPIAPDRFTGPVVAFDFVNSGTSAVVRFRFTANRPDGSSFQVAADFGVRTNRSQPELFGSMLLEAADGGLPLVQHANLLQRPGFRRPA